MNAQFWRGKRVFITGHTGFMGSWLCLMLVRMGALCHGYAQPFSQGPNLFQAAQLSNCIHSHHGDIRDRNTLTLTMEQFKPDIVFHLAGQSQVKQAYITPLDTITSNVIGTANLLEAVRATPSVRAVIIATSDKCYANRHWLWGYREDDPMGGDDPYTSSKGAAELIIHAYRSAFFHAHADTSAAIATVRAGNILGGGDFTPDRLIPDYIRAIEMKQPLHIRNPNAIRPWQFILDPLYGFVLLAEQVYTHGNDFAEGWNFGAPDNDTLTVGQLCSSFNHFLCIHNTPPAEIIIQAPLKAVHPEALLRLDTAKARQRLDWMPRVDLHSAVEMTAQWYAHYLQGKPMRELCDKQLDTFHFLA
jgi:CDP-glucose 4,6-dehydratase